RLGALTAGLDEPTLAHKPSAETFSIRENVHHLRDIEVEGFSLRLRRLLSEERPRLEGIDGDRLALERRYNERPHAQALEEFARARRESVALLERLAPREWHRAGELATVGPVSIERLVEMCTDHDRDHLGQVEAIARSFGRGGSSPAAGVDRP